MFTTKEPPSLSVPVTGLEEAIAKTQAARDAETPVIQPRWERLLKQGLAAIVIGCGIAVQFLSPAEDASAIKACSIIAAVGAGLGITSRGNPPK